MYFLKWIYCVDEERGFGDIVGTKVDFSPKDSEVAYSSLMNRDNAIESFMQTPACVYVSHGKIWARDYVILYEGNYGNAEAIMAKRGG